MKRMHVSLFAAALVVAVSGCHEPKHPEGESPHEKIAKQQIAVLKDVREILRTAMDERSARETIAKLKEQKALMGNLHKQLRDLGKEKALNEYGSILRVEYRNNVLYVRMGLADVHQRSHASSASKEELGDVVKEILELTVQE